MPKRTEMTVEEYEKYKKFVNEINENYYDLYLQILHMQLLVYAYFDNEAAHHSYSSDEIFSLIIDLCDELYKSSSKIYNLLRKND